MKRSYTTLNNNVYGEEEAVALFLVVGCGDQSFLTFLSLRNESPTPCDAGVSPYDRIQHRADGKFQPIHVTSALLRRANDAASLFGKDYLVTYLCLTISILFPRTARCQREVTFYNPALPRVG